MPPLPASDPRAKQMNGPVCPGCESTNVVVASTRHKSTFSCPTCGWTEDWPVLKASLDPSEQYKLRRRQCRHCQTLFVTAEIALTKADGSPVPWYWVNELERQKGREHARRKHGYHGLRINPRTIVGSALIRIKTTVFPPQRDWNVTDKDAA